MSARVICMPIPVLAHHTTTWPPCEAVATPADRLLRCQVACLGCCISAASDVPFTFTTKGENNWLLSQEGMGVRMYNGDPQCIAEPTTPGRSSADIAWCMDIRSKEQMEQVLSSGTAVRTVTCGLKRASDYKQTEWNRTDILDPAGYSSLWWCRTVKSLLKGTGEPGGPVGSAP